MRTGRHAFVAALLLLLGACGGEPVAVDGAGEPEPTPEVAPGGDAAEGTPSAEDASAATPDEALRAELLAMMEMDQAVRTGVAPEGDDRTADELFAAWNDVDDAHAARMREILDEHGWPGHALVGEDGATAAWVLVQHADLDPELQERGLALMEDAVARGDADPGELAYLTDRVLVSEGHPQIYGTQWEVDTDGTLIPRTVIADEAEVDARRAAMGLDPLEDYLEEFRAMLEEG